MTKAERTRQFIIERSAPIFNTKGIAATAMSDIMDATKLSKGGLYVHFDNKEDLASEVVDYNIDQLGQKVMTAIGKYRDAKEKLFAYFDVFLDHLHPPVTGGCPMMNFGTEADDTNEAVRMKVNKALDMSQKLIADIIHKGIAEGIFDAQWNYKEFATMAFAMIEGGVLMTRVSGNNGRMKVINRNLKRMVEEKMV